MIFKRFDIDHVLDEDLHLASNEFDNVSWHIEPKESFKELCKQRALQLRETYDYIILHFSGGSDSTTVLNSFLDNGIPIDEIVIKSFDGIKEPCLDGKKAENDLKLKQYNGLLTKVNITNKNINNILKNDNLILDTPNWTGQLHSFARFPIEYLEKYDFVKSKSRIGKFCNLNGEQDALVIKKNNAYYTCLPLKRKFLVSNHNSIVAFFTDKKFPQLHVKQCHILARFMHKYPHVRITNKIKKMLLRDYYSPIISPIKCQDNPEFTLNNSNIYSEPIILLKEYAKNDDSFKDLYIHSVMNEMTNITQKIKARTTQHDKWYKLFDVI